jgi:hypothetical protein
VRNLACNLCIASAASTRGASATAIAPISCPPYATKHIDAPVSFRTTLTGASEEVIRIGHMHSVKIYTCQVKYTKVGLELQRVNTISTKWQILLMSMIPRRS